MFCNIFKISALLAFYSCNGQQNEINLHSLNQDSILNKPGITIKERFNPPNGFTRKISEENSFAAYLENLKLKPFGNYVLYYDKTPKTKKDVYISVVNMEIGNNDLQQCADAVMRLRGEYLFSIQKYKEIHFNFVSDGKPRYYTDYAKNDLSYKKFRKYMNYIFSYANTASLFNELKSVSVDSMKIGDVFIQKINPYGHAVIVVDMAVNKEKGTKVFMLAQSYMPAQEIQILVNNNNPEISPWYELKDETVFTPEWTFYPNELKRFK